MSLTWVERSRRRTQPDFRSQVWRDDTGKFAFVFGQGIQNYLNEADVDVGIETNLAAGDPRRPIVGKALPMWSFIAYLDHYWSKKWSTSVGYSMMDVDNSNGQAADAYRRGHYASGNLLYYPWENVLMGGEFIGDGGRTSWMVSSPTTSASGFRLSTTFPNHSSSDFDPDVER